MLPGTIAQPEQQPAMQIDLVRLPKAYRQPVADWMKIHRPTVYEWLGGDQCKMIRAMMDAAPVLALTESEAADLIHQLPGLSRYAT